ncbi:MAG: Gfo/Idh/MocA family oxidoreductase [Clostridiales bacterium]|nr:Gfo/Idh/MocA family oxidoreductase [Clostridiales bacterium]
MENNIKHDLIKHDPTKLVTAVIVGAGHRSILYGSYGFDHPDELKVVGLVEPNELRRAQTAEIFSIPKENCFETVEELVARPRFADAAINGTMDHIHVETSLPLLEAGYHLLLEKPISTNEEDMMKLLETARRTQRKVMICHVLRYAPFYVEIRRRILDGELGEIINIQSSEHVSYHHMSVSHIRGKWNKTDGSQSSMLMAKCSHDLDILAWLKSGTAPIKVNSMGNLMQFREEKAPKGSGIRCLVDCEIEDQCLYSAKKLYLDHPERWSFYVWSHIEDNENPSMEDKIHSLKTDNPHGRCVWRCDNNVVDHQSVVIEFDDGSTATHNMVGGSSKPGRHIHVIGTKGEILGSVDNGVLTLIHPDPRPGHEYTEENIDTSTAGASHGGGDMRMMEDFVKVIRNQASSISTTSLEDSIYGHLIGFKADDAMKQGKVMVLR